MSDLSIYEVLQLSPDAPLEEVIQALFEQHIHLVTDVLSLDDRLNDLESND